MSNFRETANPYKGKNRGRDRGPGPKDLKGGGPTYAGATDGQDVEWERHHEGAQQQHPKYQDDRPEREGAVSAKSSGAPKTGTIPSRYTDPETTDASHLTTALNDGRTNRAKKFKNFGHGGSLLQQKAVAAKLRGG